MSFVSDVLPWVVGGILSLGIMFMVFIIIVLLIYYFYSALSSSPYTEEFNKKFVKKGKYPIKYPIEQPLLIETPINFNGAKKI